MQVNDLKLSVVDEMPELKKALEYLINVRKNIYNEYILDRKGRYEVSVRCTNTDFDPVIDKYGLIEIGRRRGNRYFVLSNEETRCE